MRNFTLSGDNPFMSRNWWFLWRGSNKLQVEGEGRCCCYLRTTGRVRTVRTVASHAAIELFGAPAMELILAVVLEGIDVVRVLIQTSIAGARSSKERSRIGGGG